MFELNTWLACLDWQQKLAVIGQESFRYEAFTAQENDSLLFLVRCDKLSRRGRVVMLAAPLTDSLSPERWEPDPAHRPSFVRLGKVVKTKRLNKNSKLFKEFALDRNDKELPDDLSVITIQPENNGHSNSIASLVPSEGFLLSSIGGDIKPIRSAKRAIYRFSKGGGHNLYLSDYIFDVTNAAVPEHINTFCFDGVNKLNKEQHQAILKCQNIPDATSEWSSVCRDIQPLLTDIFETAIPADLDHLTASLKPDEQWLAVLENMALLCETLTGPCQTIYTEALARIEQEAQSQKDHLEEEISQAQGRLDQTTEAIREINADIRQVQYDLDEAQIWLHEQQARWAQLWPQIYPDLEEIPRIPIEITREVIDQRQNKFEAWLSSQQDKREEQRQWDSLRRDWIARISHPSTAENKELQSDYVKHANIVGLTCLESGQKSFYEDDDFKAFDTVIIDEVSKAVPVELLMPMMCGRRTFLFGDYRQLHPLYKQKPNSHTEAVAEGQIAAEDFERYRQLITSSFFQETYEAAPDAIRQSLIEQFRMHPQIMAVINQFTMADCWRQAVPSSWISGARITCPSVTGREAGSSSPATTCCGSIRAGMPATALSLKRRSEAPSSTFSRLSWS